MKLDVCCTTHREEAVAAAPDAVTPAQLNTKARSKNGRQAAFVLRARQFGRNRMKKADVIISRTNQQTCLLVKLFIGYNLTQKRNTFDGRVYALPDDVVTRMNCT